MVEMPVAASRRTESAEQMELRRRLSTIIDASSALLESPRLDDVVPAVLVVARQVLPADATGLNGLIAFKSAPNGAYAYSFFRNLSILYLVEGVR